MNADVGDIFKGIKIKDPRDVLGIVVLVIVLVAFALTLASFLRTSAERRQANDDLETTRDAITQIMSIQSAGPDTMRKRITDAEGELNALLSNLPTIEETRTELGFFYDYANALHVELVRTEALLAPETANDSAYTVQHYLIEARGDVANLIRFFDRISGGADSTFVLDSIVISPGDPAIGNVNLTIYSSDWSANPAAAQSAPTLAPTPSQ